MTVTVVVRLYDPEGRVIVTWGATYPVAYEYDTWGRMVAMATTRDPTNDFSALAVQLAAGASIASMGSTWSLDTTRWFYDQPTGLLTNKLYADVPRRSGEAAEAGGKGPSYTYTPDGKLATRTWARGVTTAYAYDACCGALTNIVYSDATPTVAFQYDRMGRQVSAITAGVSTNLYGYSLYGQLTNETITLCASAPLRETITRTTDTLGRPTGIAAGPDYAVSCAYDSLGRFASVTSGISVVNYSYLPGSDLLAGWTAGPLTVSRTFEDNRNLLTQVLTMAGTNVISRFDYTNDSLARRTRRVDNAAVTNAFGYNLRSEVTYAAMGTNNYGYAYDPIGNREWARINANTNIYLSNPLNQYTNILTSVPSAPSVVNPRYDLDGNLTNDGHRVYFWDAENRLIGVDPPVIETGAISVRYAYDFMSRRVARAAYRWLGSNAYETVDTATYLFDGWNVIQDRTHSQTHTLTNSYVWGLDLSGSLQGAGGIGGLLSASLSGTNVVYGYDANGNVTDLVDTNGTLTAHYQYDPFGRAVVAEGAAAADNPFRFSTKHWDDVTGLGYWGYRWYEPEMGRWLSRDPIGEKSFFRFVTQSSSEKERKELARVALKSAYLYVDNNPAGKCDALGLFFIIIEPFPPLPEPRYSPPSLSTDDSCKCCKDMSEGLELANKAMRTGKCWKWFKDHGATGDDFKVKCYGWKLPALLGFPAWTTPLANRIGFNKDNCEDGGVTIASLLIHEVAHHHVTFFIGREDAALSAQEACDDALLGQDPGPNYPSSDDEVTIL